jgi:hypothetical protein
LTQGEAWRWGEKRKGARPAPASAKEKWIRCAGYQLDVWNSEASFFFELDVTADDGKEYYLRVKRLNDRTGQVQRTLKLLGERWPAYDWYFQADGDGSITDVR